MSRQDPAEWAKYQARLAEVRAENATREAVPMTDAHRQHLRELGEREDREAAERVDAWLRSGEGRDHRNADGYERGEKAASLRPLAVEVRPTAKPGRQLRLTSAADVQVRRTRWLWDARLALGTLALVGGREGTGKTLLTNDLVAHITKGTLPGEHHGQPRNVIIVTTEDSWSMTVAPRLLAAGAIMSRVFRVEATTADGVLTGLSLPHDLDALEAAVKANDVALIVLDPLISRLDAALDTHKDAEVRLALEPLVALAERTQATLLGLIHVNKSSTSDPLTMLMASRAFPAVARAVLFVMGDPEEPGVRLVGQAKNNLGRTDLPTLRFTVEEVVVGKDPEDGLPVKAGRVVWQDSTKRTISDALAAMLAGPKRRTQTDEAGEWLVAYLQGCPDGRADSAEVKAAGGRAGISEKSLRSARVKVGIEVITEGFPKTTDWQLPVRLVLQSDE